MKEKSNCTENWQNKNIIAITYKEVAGDNEGKLQYRKRNNS